ncbi:UDP-glucuronic acid decarboxylase family protein [Hyalangium rubrum]|uniref:UDP-glucuronic acid decarboxylase family protein n=1 Tax=Hyalangium rubrum TaxID=3103134 RepID=A0ABU5HHC5_9BACT|nr:UDP-glucuronic acid decarboxylase family protein [Hyalangium sp. s54d21]MDY7232636.1 UDP-glucuronic acid decarboxylase family protein [Hyalangium sp. s54d21]
MNGKRIVVLGGTGFLGSHLCERLLRDGAEEVISLDNGITGDESNVTRLSELGNILPVRHDITEPIRLLGPVDYVFNLASPASPINYSQLPIETLRVGALGTENGLRLAREKGAVFLQASTSEVYGDPLVHPQREDYWGNVNPIGPRACYDEAKRYGEALVMAYHRAHGVRTRIARIFNTYGPKMRLVDGRVVPAFIGQALRGEDFTVFGDGSQTRSFCYVRDLIDGLVRLALSDVLVPVNLGNPREMTILQLAEAVRTAAGGGGRIVFQPLPREDPKQRRPDISRARLLLGWEPQVSLEEGLAETLAYFRKVLGISAPAGYESTEQGPLLM